jgi:peptidyl-prolyl cis-trans isomerase C
MPSSTSKEAPTVRGGFISMGGATAKILGEPLIHFLLIGAAIFGFYVAVIDAPVAAPENRITVTALDIERLRGLWERQWQVPPTAEELRGLIEEHIREEVLYREALALGLDSDDTIVRRRLAQKFEFLTEDIAASRDPTDAELAAFFESNLERYRIPPRISFTQVYFDPYRRGGAAEQDAKLALADLRTGSPEVTSTLGDGSMLDRAYRKETPQGVEAVFGRDFAAAVFAHGSGAWFGPVASGYGLHLVRIDERSAGRLPMLSEVETTVRTDWSYEQRRQANEAIYRRLLDRYAVVIADGALDGVAPAAPGADREARQ